MELLNVPHVFRVGVRHHTNTCRTPGNVQFEEWVLHVIQVDQATRNLYWTDSKMNAIDTRLRCLKD